MSLPDLINSASIPKKNIQTKKHDLISPEAWMMYMVVKGALIETFEHPTLGKSYVKRLLGPEDIFPLYIPQTARDLNVTYQTTVLWLLVQFSEHDFVELQKKTFDIRMLYMKYVWDILQATDERSTDIQFLSTEQRIIKLLIQLAENPQFTKDYHGQKEIKCWLTHEQIWSLTGSSRQTVTQVLQALCTNKLISYNRNRILIFNLPQLQQHMLWIRQGNSAKKTTL